MEMPTTISALLPVAAPGIMRNNGLNSMHSREEKRGAQVGKARAAAALNPGGALRKAAHGGDAEQAAQDGGAGVHQEHLAEGREIPVLIQQPRFARHGEARAQCAEEIVDQQHDDERKQNSV